MEKEAVSFTETPDDCTSPSQLQEVSLTQDSTFFSTVGLSSKGQMRGRPINEIEEQLSNLKRENFNLKLRIYFLEEKMGSNFTLDKDNVFKKNIELETEVKYLQKEIEEKHALLCQAVKAMELEEEEHKKILNNKEEELNFYQQEAENLRLQLQDSKFDSDGMSLKSDTTGFNSSRKSSKNHMEDLQEKIRMLQDELLSEKETTASLQLLLDQAEGLKYKYENLQKDLEIKEEIIKEQQKKIESLVEDKAELAKQVRDLKEKLSQSLLENQKLMKKNQVDARKLEEALAQSAEIKRKYSLAKGELEKEQKKLERTKFLGEVKVSELEEENQKHKLKIRDLQSKLESALVEIRKNQNLAVSKSPKQLADVTNTYSACLSVPDAATPAGAAQADALPVPVGGESPSPPPPPMSPPDRDAADPLRAEGGVDDDPDKILSQLHALRKENNAQNKKIIKLKGEQMQACNIIKSMMESRNRANEEIARLKEQVEGLEKELESVVTRPSIEGTFSREDVPREQEKAMAESQYSTDEVSKRYEVFIAELETKVGLLEAIIKEKDSHIANVQDSCDKLQITLEEKENRIVDLELELMVLLQGNEETDSSLQSKRETSSFYREVIESKNKEIEKLGGELKQCTCYLQEIVNTELWEKNKEIEKLHIKQANPQVLADLKKELAKKDHQLQLLKDKISELGLDMSVLNDQESAPNKLDQSTVSKEDSKTELEEMRTRDYQEQIRELSENIETLKSALEKSERLREKSNEVCSLLSNRLEELAVFLDTLLKQKSVLGFLGLSKERKLREVINTSLDLTKSFSMSMLVPSDESLLQLSNISTILNGSAFQDLFLQPEEDQVEKITYSIVPENITLTYQNHLKTDNKEEIITALREQVVHLESELRLRDNELNRFTIRELTDKSTETETEFVRSVRLLNTTTTSTTFRYQSECQSESEAWSEPDRVVSRARIGLNRSLKEPEQVTLSTEGDEVVTPTKKTGEKRLSFVQLQQQISRLQDEVQEKAKEAVDLGAQLRLVEELCENHKKEAEESKAALEAVKRDLVEAREEKLQLIEKLRKEYEESSYIVIKDAEDNFVRRVKEIEESAESTIKTLNETYQRDYIKKIEVEAKIEEAKERLRKEYEESACVKIKQAEDAFTERVTSIEERAAATIRTITEEYRRNYIKRVEVESKMKEVDALRDELRDLKDTVKSYEETIEAFKTNEARVSQEYQEKINLLRKELDNTTLQYSEAILERTRLVSEKAQLEQEARRHSSKGVELRRELDELKSEFERATASYQQQVQAVQRQKSTLDGKISELESANAELHNKLVRLQCDRFPSSSEENLVERTQADRQGAVSSPDLGIDSDQGRFSSLETHSTNVTRPLQQTLELTASMSNLLGDGDVPGGMNCGCSHCYERNLEIFRENSSLKQKLQSMMRTLEETVNQLNLANRRKKEVERTICKQINKTSQVLRKAKANLDSSSESDVVPM